MKKRFGRPAPTFEKPNIGGPIRAIRLPREDASLEGAYAQVAAREAFDRAGEALSHELAVKSGAVNWILMLGFWSIVAALAVTLLS